MLPQIVIPSKPYEPKRPKEPTRPKEPLKPEDATKKEIEQWQKKYDEWKKNKNHWLQAHIDWGSKLKVWEQKHRQYIFQKSSWDRETSGSQAERQNISGKNLGRFYTRLAAGIFRGTQLDESEIVQQIEFQGELRGFQPDILFEDDGGRTATEVKATSKKKQRPYCRVRQVENAFFWLLDQYNAGEVPVMNEVLFRYGNRRKMIPFHFSQNNGLVYRLSNETRDVLNVPYNLMAFMLKCSSRNNRNHMSSKGRCFEDGWELSGKAITLFHRYPDKPLQAAEELLKFKTGSTTPQGWRRALGHFNLDDFYLDTLIGDQYRTSDIAGKISMQGFEQLSDGEFKLTQSHDVAPFSITQYHMPRADYIAWLEGLNKNHRFQLESCLGIEDIYADIKARRSAQRARKLAEQY
jgi:hypothetical protein